MPMTMDELQGRVSGVRRAMRYLFLLGGSGRVLLLVALAAAFLFAADWFLVLPAGARTVLFLLALGGAGLAFVRYVAFPLGVPIPDDAIVERIERANPGLQESLISALQFRRRQDDVSRRIMSQAMVQATVEKALAAAAPIRFGAILRPLWACVAFGLGIGVSGALLGIGALAPETSSVFLSRVWGGPAKWPQRTNLVVENPTSTRMRIAAGEDLVVRVRAEKEVPSRVRLVFRFPGTGESGEARMTRTEEKGDRFEFAFARLVSPVRFRMEGGDASTEEYEVTVLEPPRLASIRVWLEPPAYTKVPPTPEAQPQTDGNIQAPSGTRARVRVESTKDLQSASLGFQPSKTVLAMKKTEARVAEAGFDVARTEHYGIQLRDEEGLENRTPTRFTVRAVPDRRPRITVPRPDSTSLWVTPGATLPFEIKVDDDYGVNRVELRVVRTSRDHKPLVIPLEPAGGAPRVPWGPPSAAYPATLDLSSLEVPGEDAPRKVREGDLVLVQAAATDFQEPTPNPATSAEYRLTVVSPGKLEGIVEERMIHVKDLLRRAHGEQETTRATVQELREALAAEEVWDASHREKLLGAQTGQRGVGQRLDGAAKELERILSTVLANRLGDPDYQRKIQEMGKLAAHLAGERCADALAGMEKARSQPGKREQLQGLTDAAQVQQDIQKAIAELLERMEKWEDYNEVVKILREVRDLQESIRRDTLDEAKEREKSGKK
jgi:hypothetical protein